MNEDIKCGNKQTIQVSARIRRSLSWEDPQCCIEYEDNALGVSTNNTSLKGERIVNFYQFDEVFRQNKQNQDVFDDLCLKLCSTTLNKGYNSILIAYGQTGSGKTYTMIGKKHENVIGVLPLCLQWFYKQSTVKKLSISAVEIYGISTQKIQVFDLMDVQNKKNKKWQDKKEIDGRRNDLHLQFIQKQIKSLQQCIDVVTDAQMASHFAPTGKNPQSSRGHIAYIVTLIRTNGIISNFVALDLAGSEGESALTASFAKKVCKKILQNRRLEAGIINYGLSQLQKLLSEIRRKGVSVYTESGLRKVLHPYISKESLISILFTLSPSMTNIKSTRSTLRVANVVSQIEIIPRMMKYEKTPSQIIKQLKSTVEEQQTFITLLKTQLDKTKTTANIQNNELETKQKALDQMIAEVDTLRQTESKLCLYADSSQSELVKTKTKMGQIQCELELLKQKERELDELNNAIDTAIIENGNDTIFDDELQTDEYEQIHSNTQRESIKLRVAQRFSTLIDEKEKQFEEITQKLKDLQCENTKLQKINAQLTEYNKESILDKETITAQQQIINKLQFELAETQMQNADDIMLDIQNDSDHNSEEVIVQEIRQQKKKKTSCCTNCNIM